MPFFCFFAQPSLISGPRGAFVCTESALIWFISELTIHKSRNTSFLVSEKMGVSERQARSILKKNYHKRLDQVNSANLLFGLWSLVFYVLICYRICRAEREYRAICLFRKLENRKKAEICNIARYYLHLWWYFWTLNFLGQRYYISMKTMHNFLQGIWRLEEKCVPSLCSSDFKM